MIRASLTLKKKMFSLNSLNDFLEFPLEIRYGGGVEKEGGGMSQKKVSEILKLVEFLNEEVKEVSKKLSRVTPREISEKLGALALLREKILNLSVDLPPDLEKNLIELYPAIEKLKQKPS